MNVGMNLISSMNASKPQMAGVMNAMNNAKMRTAEHPHMDQEAPHFAGNLAGNLAANNCCKLA